MTSQFDQPFYNSNYDMGQQPAGAGGASPPPDYSNFAPQQGQAGPYYGQDQFAPPPQQQSAGVMSYTGSIMQPEQPSAIGSTGFEDEPPLLEGSLMISGHHFVQCTVQICKFCGTLYNKTTPNYK